MGTCSPDDTAKSQAVRLLDIAVIGPLMVWGGMRLRRENELGGLALALFGVTTVIYNARNYARVADACPRST